MGAEIKENRPPIWQLVKAAMHQLNREVSYGELKNEIWSQYPDVNSATLTCHIILCSVNHPSRIHYPENKKPRLACGPHDFLFYTRRGYVTPYDPEVHGRWEIVEDSGGNLAIYQLSAGLEDSGGSEEGEDVASSLFAVEAHLRDYLARNLEILVEVGESLRLFESDDGRSGIEFQTDVGPIGVLAVNGKGDLWVFELKLSRGPDRALGQILRYMGWIRKNLAKGKEVRGAIIAAEISDKLRYAASCVPDVKLFTYRLTCSVQPVAPV